MKKQRGFSLIELLVVIAIIGILSTIGIMSFADSNKKARDSRRRADIQQIRSALEMFRSDCGHYPVGSINNLMDDSTETCTEGVPNTRNFKANYLSGKRVEDPQNASHQYTYSSLAPGASYTLTHYLEVPNATESYSNP